MQFKGTGLLLKASAESFVNDKTGEIVPWVDVAMLVGGELVQGTGTPDLLEGLNGSRKAFEEGQVPNGIAVNFTAQLNPDGRNARRFKVKVVEVAEVAK